MLHKRIKPLILALLIPVLILTGCSNTTPSPASLTSSPTPSEPPSPSPSYETVNGIKIKTDYAQLTPYAPEKEVYARLKSGDLPELAPSKDYGLLLPYTGAKYSGGSDISRFNTYGLVTSGGMLVTDPVYAEIRQGALYGSGAEGITAYKPAYCLTMIVAAKGSNEIRRAVCGLDGSWVTPFDYEDVIFADSVILLIRDALTNTCDVMDYSGKLLYRFADLDCAKRFNQNFYNTMTGCGEGYMQLKLDNGTAFVDELTGKTAALTDYTFAYPFRDGLSCVRSGSLFGYIDKSFKTVLPLQYLSAEPFVNGRAAVELQDGTWAVIDTSGAVLYQDKGFITNWLGGSVFTVSMGSTSRYVGADFKPHDELPNGAFVYNLSGIWCSVQNGNNQAVLTDGSAFYTYPGVWNINGFHDGLFSYTAPDGSGQWVGGVMTVDGKDVIPRAATGSIAFADTSGGKTLIIVNTDTFESFCVYDSGGALLLSGRGQASYDHAGGFIAVDSGDAFAYLDLSGHTVFRLSLGMSLPD